MSTLVRLQRKGQMVIPRAVRERAGIPEGTLLDVSLVEGGNILLTPQLTIKRSVVTGAKKGRKALLRELAQAVDELRRDAREKGIDKMPMSEINRAVAAARRDLGKKTTKKPAR